MSKKYLSVEEAAEVLGLTTSEVLRAREQDKIRGFADRGTWKFKAEDVDNYKRDMGSDLDIGLGSDLGGGDVLSDDDVLSEQPTVIRKGEQSSDSDVRLIYSGAPSADIPLADSDSDVRLAGAQKSALDSSDSDVKLVQGDKSVSADRSVSDVRLTPLEDGDMDLNVGSSYGTGPSSGFGSSFGTASSDSDSDVKLVGRASSTEIPVSKSKSGIKPSGKPAAMPPPAAAKTADDTIDFNPPLDSDDSSVLEGDSGISLVGDSGISLERPADSGISLEKADSGISLSSDSALNLAHDSGISLDITSDSGISLAESADDAPPMRKPPASKKGSRTVPDLEIGLADEMDVSDTNMEVPLLDDDESKDSSYDLADSADSTSVITLDEDSGDEFAETVATPKGKAKRPASSSDQLEEAVFDESEDVEVADEAGEDDELEEMDVFGAGDEDFDDSFQEGESQHDMEVAPRQVAAVEHEWGTGVFATLTVTAVLMVVCGAVSYDLLQTIWHSDAEGRNPLSSTILGMLGGLFGG